MKKKEEQKHYKGNAFMKEKTGSATMINLDGRWEHNFIDDQEPQQDIVRKKIPPKDENKIG
ncbi:hypothetical protein [Desulfolucanica intricata]|uniref:hypothetical protein n=1 Tax=Desulfolucanica intricata TaxID=1285191 RepID=UPI000833CE7A|nr:hypothetical protein [Desulfolucanica intricata]